MIKTDLSDSCLISLYKKGNEEALSSLFERHKSRIFTTVFFIVKDRYVAEDILQEVFIKTINVIKSKKYNEQGKFLPWILRVAHNMAIDNFRKEKRHPKITLADGSDIFNCLKFSESTDDNETLSKSSKRYLKKMILKLPEKQREVLVMRLYMNMSFQEIAKETGVSINTALGRMRYALLALRKKIKIKQIAYE
ncbi:MAG: RNA polymerase subunit sigma-24 [Gammaproteobacteria bacterium]|jgi:RNA polymerase sigma-70 factor (ECF subfamily)|nr:RNA polymerase subunit sigma-24 [Gammaproteobacteria bacterium]|tara:strand:- start:6066 stop:6647 length:582 start_codon:yes stop_codon:yes gene_type:complete